MSTTKRCISLLLALVMVLGLILQLPLIASAEQLLPKVTADAPKIEPTESTGTTEDGFVYTVHDGYVEITGYKGSATELVIPDTIGDLPVTTIGKHAFYNCKSLTSVIIPGSVATIGVSAFSYCTSLNSVEIGDGVTCIDDQAFRHCTSLSSIELPDSVITIGEYTFNDCFGLTSVTIPDSVTTIGGSAFNNCKGLRSVEIGDGVTSIGTYAFWKCSSLISVEIGDGVTSIPYAAFSDCISLTSVIIPDNITVIGWNAFAGCVSLGSVEIGDSVSDISDGAFRNCESLTCVVIPSSVTTIRNSVFENCTSLESIIFQGDAPNIFLWAFANLTTTAYYPSGNPTWTSNKLQNYDGNITWVPGNPYVEITTSTQNYSNVDTIKITPSVLDPAWSEFGPLSGVTVSCSIGEKIPIDGEYIIRREDASAQEMILSKDGYRDYILPAEITRTMRGKKGTAYKLTAYMQKDTKDGKPYISTVFGRESDGDKTYTDLRSNPLAAKEDSGCDVIVTAVGFGDQEVTYYLAQDSKRKVNNNTGVFTDEQLYNVFDNTSTVYAYAVGSDGTQTEPLAIKVKRVEKFDLEKELGIDSEISLLGKDSFQIKISDDIPVLCGMELDMSAFTFPVGVSAEGDEMKISLGVDLFSSTDSDEGYKWKTFKDMFMTDEDIDLKAIETFCNVYDLAQGHFFMKSKKANKFNVNVLGFVEGKWIDGEFVIKEGQISLGGNFKLQYNAQGAVWVVPVYGSVEAGTDFSVGGKVNRFLPDGDVPFEFTMLLDVAPKVKGGAGAGIKGTASLGLYAQGKLPLMIAFQEEHFTLDLDGEIGVEGELFLLHGKKALLDGDTNLIDWYYGTSASPSAVSNVPEQSQTVTMVVSRDYAENTSAWLGDRGPALSIHSMGTNTTASRGVTFRELQTSIFSNSQPQLVTVGDQMLITWVEDDASRDTYNRMRLVYSVYDPLSDSWSDPLPVWDDGHNDGYPILASDGSQAYVLWQKVNTTLTAENTTDIDTTIENSELCLARFNVDTGTFGDAQMITDNDLYEYAHNVVLENGEPVVYWAAAEENAMNTSGTNTLNCWTNGIISTLAQDLNYVLSIDACDGEVSYVADVDGDLSSTEDVTATTVSDFGTEVFDNSELGSAVMYAGYAPLDGESVLFLSDMRNIYYNHNGEVKSVLVESRTMDGNLNIVETDEGATMIWTEAVDGWNEIFAVMYKDGEWSAPVMISENGKLLTKISVTSCEGKLFGVCNANAVTYDEAAGEYLRGETDLALFQFDDFSDIALADYLNINENALAAGAETTFNVTVYNNGTNSVDAVTFTVADTLGTESVQTVAAAIPSGSSETVTLTYPVPNGYTTTTLTVTAGITDVDVDESDNSVSRTIGNPDLTVTETAVEILDEGYKITAIVENGSLVDAENVTISAFADEEKTELLRSETIGTISRENYALAEILVKECALSYSESGTAKIYLKLKADEKEVSVADNNLCVVISKAAETVCMHPVTELVARLEPTCTEPGYEAYEICAACGEAIGESSVIPALGHSHTAVVAEPTCTERGYTTYTCSCGDGYVADYVDALGHDMSNWETTVPATCTENGEAHRNCSRCDHAENREIEAVGHSWDKGVVTREPTEDTEGERLYTCTACGATQTESIPVIGHEHIYETVVTAPTCTERGYTSYTCECGESYTADYAAALGHSFGDWVVIQEPTTKEDGVEERSCTRCGYTEERTIEIISDDRTDHFSDEEWELLKLVNKERRNEGLHPLTGFPLLQQVAHIRAGELSELPEHTRPDGSDCFTAYDEVGLPRGSAGENIAGGQYSPEEAMDDWMNSSGHRGNILYTGFDSVGVGYYFDPDSEYEQYWVQNFRGYSDNFTSYQVVMPNGNKFSAETGFDDMDIYLLLENPDDGFVHYLPLTQELVSITTTKDAMTVTFDLLGLSGSFTVELETVNPFSDVTPGSFYYEPVMWAIENGITNGTSATTFGPNDQCMRAHVVTFLWRAVGSPEPTRTDNPFVDVKPTDFYYKPVLWALEKGITSGMDATHFGPTSYCNRAQVVTFLYRTMGSPKLDSMDNPFDDVQAGAFYEKPVLWAVQNGITNGLSATTFGPNAICNRAQIVTFLYRAFVD